MMLRVVFVCAEFPYPPTHGGRADTWRRLLAFAEAGAEVLLICWYSNRRGRAPNEQELDVVRKVVADVIVLPIELSVVDLVWRAVNLFSMPSHASARLPRWGRRQALFQRVEAFKPTALWLDGLWPGAFVQRLAKHFKLPYFYRSHNIEYRYMARQAALAGDWKYRFRLKLALPGLEGFERRIIQGARVVFDISMTDLAFWQAQGLVREGRWLPPIVFPVAPAASLENPEVFDVVFVGNLHTPNNVEGLKWFLQEVWPRVRRMLPDVRVLLAGSAPSREIFELVAASEGCELRADPDEVWPIYRAARVLVNPVRSGSGVNIKSVEMLQFDVPIVSTSIGAGGLPEVIRSEFLVRDDAEGFAAALNEALNGQLRVDMNSREVARMTFAPGAVADVLACMGDCVESSPVVDAVRESV